MAHDWASIGASIVPIHYAGRAQRCEEHREHLSQLEHSAPLIEPAVLRTALALALVPTVFSHLSSFVSRVSQPARGKAHHGGKVSSVA